MESALSEIATLPSGSKTAAYTSLLDKTLASSGSGSSDQLARDLGEFIKAAVHDSVGLVVSRQVGALFVKRLSEDVKDAAVKQKAAETALEALQSRQASFEEQVNTHVNVFMGIAFTLFLLDYHSQRDLGRLARS